MFHTPDDVECLGAVELRDFVEKYRWIAEGFGAEGNGEEEKGSRQ